MPDQMLDNLDDLLTVLCDHASDVFPTNKWGKRAIEDGNLYCPDCGDYRKVATTVHWLSHLYSAPTPQSARLVPLPQGPPGPATFQTHVDTRQLTGFFSASTFKSELRHGLLSYECLQCRAVFTGLIYPGPEGTSLAVFSTCYGGLRTPGTPDGVAFYLDQAHRAHSVDANSAAVAMYRAALDQLLFEQGYTKGMCGKKLEAMNADIVKGNPRPWVKDVNPTLLAALKDLGNAAIHPNDGDVEKQKTFDNRLLVEVQIAFAALLDAVYERPEQERRRLKEFEKAKERLSGDAPDDLPATGD